MSARLGEVAAVSVVATCITIVMAMTVLGAPSERVFGMELVGRHHDPFTVMQQFARAPSVSAYAQPVTDIAGALIARIAGPVAAYNWIVLLSFPLAAAAAYLLARHLSLSAAGALFAALAYAFSPFHLAHAAYHPHIAQTQWMPLYLLALWRCLDAATPGAVAFLGLASVAVTLSNFYGGLIAAVITPTAVLVYWFAMRPAGKRPTHALRITVLTLVLIAACGGAYAWYAAHAVVVNAAAFSVPPSDLSLHSARWWSYLVPPIANPLAGDTSRAIWMRAGVHEALLEQQVSLGWGVIALGLIAVSRCVFVLRNRHSACGVRVPIVVAVGVTALLFSFSSIPLALLYDTLPMFRSYARFGVVVQLMAVLLAGVGVDFLWRAGLMRARIVCSILVAIVALEYAVAPQALSRDVLPTAAHRWIMRQPGDKRAFDCTVLDDESASVQWLTSGRITPSRGALTDCAEPNLPDKLAAGGYAHLLVRRHSAGRTPGGLRLAASFEDAQVFVVPSPEPTVYTAVMTGFFPREHNADWSWRWMSTYAGWTIVNTGSRDMVAKIDLELSAFHHARRMEILFDGQPPHVILVDPTRRDYHVGPVIVPPGSHSVVFRPAEPPSIAHDLIGNGDSRELSVAIGNWRWTVHGAQE